MNNDDIVCMCMNISILDIKNAIAAGATDFNDVQKMTGISTICGLCMNEAEGIVNKILQEKNN